MVAAYYITGDVLHSVQYIGVFLIVAGLFGVVYATHKEQKLILMSKQIV
jgi:drug/metabolite transporter (DMT)-like permease